MDLTRLFKVNTLQGQTFSFHFNCIDNLQSFRTNIIAQSLYTIIYKGKQFIFSNDDDNASIESLILLTDVTMLDLDVIQCHLTLNLGFPRLRQGKLLISESKNQTIENSNTNTSIDLLCPISLSTIQYAVKINNHYYDLDAISEYLANGFNNSNGTIPKCPMRIDLPEELLTHIIKYHYSTTKQVFNEFSKSSMQSCLYPMTKHYQQEYNTLISTTC